MNIRGKLKSKLEKLDVSSLSDEQVDAISKFLEKPSQPKKKSKSKETDDDTEQSLLHKIIELNPYAIAILDSDGRLVSLNKVHVDSFETVPPKTLSIFNDPIIKSAGYAEKLENAKRGEIFHIDELWYNPHKLFPELPDKEICIHLSIFPIHDKDKKIANHVLVYEDITKRKHAEKAIDKNEEKYRNIFENIQTVYYETAIDGIITEISPSVEYFTKYKREELIGTNVFDAYFNREDRGKLLQQITRDGELRDYCIELKDKDNSKLHCSLNSKLIKNNAGVPEKIIGAIIDITQLHKALNSLKASENRFKDIYENANDIIITTDLKGNILSVNPAGEKISEFKHGETDEPNIKKFLTEESFNHVIENIRSKFLNEKTNTTYEVEAIGKNDKHFFLEINSFLKYKDNKPFEIFGIARDITERKKAEEDLNKTRERYRELIETSSDVIYTMDFQGTITSVNPMAQIMLGYNFEELTEPNMKDYVSPETLKLAFENISAKLKGEKLHSVYEAEFRKSDGSFITFEINSQLRYKDGVPIEIFGIAREITQRKIAEEKEKTYNSHISTLMKSATRFVELSPDENIWNAIAEYLGQLTSAKFLLVSSYNKDINELKTEVFCIDQRNRNQVTKLLGHKVTGMAFNPTDKVLSEIKSKTIVKISGGLYEFAGEMIPRPICTAIEKMFNIGSIHGMGFSINDEIFGCASLVLKEGEVIEDENILKTYMHQVSTVLQRRKTEIELKRNEEKYRTIFENAPLGIMTADNFGNIIEINPTLLQLLGSKSLEDTRNINIMEFQPLIDVGFVNTFQQCIETGNAIISHGKYTSKNNKTFDARIYAKPLQDTDDKVSGVQVIVEDITDEKLAEKKIKAALAEKEVLLREIHHRVKNNMQIIISLINMQLQESNDPLIIRQFKELQQRVRTMSIIHEDLYISEDLSKINFGNYLQKLANNLLQIYPHNFEIDLKFDISNVHLGIDSAIPCGLIVNELMSNSFKHAFPEEWISENGKKKHQVIIEFKSKGNKCFLAVGDNGIGMPSLKEAQKKNTLGLVLVEVLVNQLRGTLKMNSDNGSRYEIEFGREGN